MTVVRLEVDGRDREVHHLAVVRLRVRDRLLQHRRVREQRGFHRLSRPRLVGLDLLIRGRLVGRVNAVPHERDDARPVRPVANLGDREIDGVIRLVLVDRADALDAAVVVTGREGLAEMIRGLDRARDGALLAADGGADFRVDRGPVEVLVEGDDLLLVERFAKRGRRNSRLLKGVVDRAQHLGLVIALDRRNVGNLRRHAVERRSVSLLLDGVLDRLARVDQRLKPRPNRVVLDDELVLQLLVELGDLRVQHAHARLAPGLERMHHRRAADGAVVAEGLGVLFALRQPLQRVGEVLLEVAGELTLRQRKRLIARNRLERRAPLPDLLRDLVDPADVIVQLRRRERAFVEQVERLVDDLQRMVEAVGAVGADRADLRDEVVHAAVSLDAVLTDVSVGPGKNVRGARAQPGVAVRHERFDRRPRHVPDELRGQRSSGKVRLVAQGLEEKVLQLGFFLGRQVGELASRHVVERCLESASRLHRVAERDRVSRDFVGALLVREIEGDLDGLGREILARRPPGREAGLIHHAVGDGLAVGRRQALPERVDGQLVVRLDLLGGIVPLHQPVADAPAICFDEIVVVAEGDPLAVTRVCAAGGNLAISSDGGRHR